MEFHDFYEHIDPKLMYTPENIPTQETEDQFNEQFINGCECEEFCTVEDKCTCLEKSGASYSVSQENHESYVINIRDANKPIYECNTKCKCYGKSCGNRLVQFGPRKHLKVIICKSTVNEGVNSECNASNKKIKLDKTTDKQSNQKSNDMKGLGLISTGNIKQGNFVCEYAGEVISKTEANKRHKLNEQQTSMNYIFCINEHFGGNNFATYIDPSTFGNIGRYLNHSCQPNCELIPVRVNNTVPKLAIFALQDVKNNCELTFDYGSDSLKCLEDNSNEKRIKCLCGTATCRKYLPFSRYT